MRIDNEGDKLFITLGSCCAIMYVEEHTALLKETMTKAESLTKVVVDLSDVEEMDTAYMQMLMILKQETLRHKAEFVATAIPLCVQELQDCLGISPKEKK